MCISRAVLFANRKDKSRCGTTQNPTGNCGSLYSVNLGFIMTNICCTSPRLFNLLGKFIALVIKALYKYSWNLNSTIPSIMPDFRILNTAPAGLLSKTQLMNITRLYNLISGAFPPRAFNESNIPRI